MMYLMEMGIFTVVLFQLFLFEFIIISCTNDGPDNVLYMNIIVQVGILWGERP